MRNMTRTLSILGLLWLEIVLYMQVQAREKAGGDETVIIVLFLAIIFLAIVIGGVVALAVVPAIGETIGNFFFNPNQEIEKNPHSNAMAKIAQGDYEGAIEAYKKNVEEDPEDMHALSEVIHIYCDKLHDHDSAERYLEEALKNEWPPEQGAFLASRLVDVYWNHRHDAERARHVLMQIAETMPNTKHAANAVHRLHEIDRALAEEEMAANLHSKPGLPAGQEPAETPPGEASRES